MEKNVMWAMGKNMKNNFCDIWKEISGVFLTAGENDN